MHTQKLEALLKALVEALLNVRHIRKFLTCSNCSSRSLTYKEKRHEKLEGQLKQLTEVKDRVRRKIETTEEQPHLNQTMKVEDWLSRVEEAESEVLEEDIDRLRSGGFRSRRKSSQLRNKVTELLREANSLVEGNILGLAEEIEPRDEAKKGVCKEESTVAGIQKSILDQVWKCFDKKEVGIVGLYGMCGVGKTTILKEVRDRLLETQNDGVKVIWVEVPDGELQLERIQEQIGKEIGLWKETWEIENLEEKEITGRSFGEKASKIFNVLSQKRFVLLLDDVWEMIDLERVGVPVLPDPESGSKIVFTTRSREVCSLMEADADFKVGCLPYAEAWELFRRKVGGEALDRQTEVHQVAQAIVKECHGLPLALATVGQAMADRRTTQEWIDELQGLKRWTSSFSGSGPKLKRDALLKLKLSYDRLQKDMLKSCLMYCSLFPSNYKIRKRDLIDYWIGEGLLNERVLGAQNQGYSIIDVLCDACLLEEEEEDYVKIHGLIPEMILWITGEFDKEKGNFFICTHARLTEVPEIEKWKDMTRVSVMENQIKNLAKLPRCPYLETLFVNSNQLEKIDDIVFGFMPSLKVLNLSDNRSLIELPSGISGLVSLQYLDLSRTDIRELPEVLMDLINLKCLNLEHTNQLCMIPRQMMSNFTKLQVLRLLNCGSCTQATDSVLHNGGEFLLEELLCLKRLIMLSIALKCFQALQKYLSSHKLQLCTQSLELQSLQHPKSLKVALADLNHLKTLCISDCKNLEQLEIDYGGKVQNICESRSFPFLEEVDIEYCSKLRDLTWLILAPNLKRLRIIDCAQMEVVIDVGKLNQFPEMMANLVPFSKLKFLRLVDLPNLLSIYWNVWPFQEDLKEDIQFCDKLQRFNKLKNSVEEQREYPATKRPSLDPSPSSSS